MQEENLQRNNLIKWLVIFGAWGFVAVIFTFKVSMSAASMGRSFSFLDSITTQGVSCFGWVLLTPLIIWSAERFLPDRKNLYQNTFFLLLAGIVVVLLQTLYQTIFLPLADAMPSGKIAADSFFGTYKGMLSMNWLLSSSLYLMTLGVVIIGTYYRKYQERELISSKLEANLNRARLQLLKTQLHPHFLFNTHNAITELIHKEPNTAEKMLTNLSDLLRISLDQLEVEEVTLQQELEFVEKYIEIEQMRFQERLKFELKISPDTLDAIVPNMILQPLIENAVKHGITPLRDGGTIKISAFKNNNFLYIKVSDNGIGLPKNNKKFLVRGIGLANTKARLLHLYKKNQSFKINPDDEKGFAILIKIPFKKAEEKVQPHPKLLNAELVGSN